MTSETQKFEISALILDRRSSSAEEFMRVLEREVNLVECDFTNNLLRALTLCVEIQYSFCFIAEDFAEDELRDFFKDAKKSNSKCLFVQLRKQIPKNFDRSSLSRLGFSTIVSRKLGHEDRQALKWEVTEIIKEHDFGELTGAMESLLQEIDKAAEKKRLGLFTRFSDATKSIVKKQLEKHEDFFSPYLDSMANLAIRPSWKREKGKKVVDKKGRYAGASKRLRKKYGTDE